MPPNLGCLEKCANNITHTQIGWYVKKLAKKKSNEIPKFLWDLKLRRRPEI